MKNEPTMDKNSLEILINTKIEDLILNDILKSDNRNYLSNYNQEYILEYFFKIELKERFNIIEYSQKILSILEINFNLKIIIRPSYIELLQTIVDSISEEEFISLKNDNDKKENDEIKEIEFYIHNKIEEMISKLIIQDENMNVLLKFNKSIILNQLNTLTIEQKENILDISLTILELLEVNTKIKLKEEYIDLLQSIKENSILLESNI